MVFWPREGCTSLKKFFEMQNFTLAETFNISGVEKCDILEVKVKVKVNVDLYSALS